MVSRTQLIIITVLLVIGIAGPIASMIARQHQTENKDVGENTAPPTVFTPIEKYYARTNCTIVEMYPQLFAIGVSDYGNRKEIEQALLAIDGVKSVNITRTENEGSEGLYRYDFVIECNSSSSLEYVSYKAGKIISFKGIKLASPIVATALLQLPDKVVLDDKTMDISSKSSVKGIVYPFTKPLEKTKCDVEMEVSEGKIKKIVAVESYRQYMPSYEIVKAEVNGTIENITEKVVEIEVENSTNKTVFERTFEESNGYNVDVKRMKEQNKTYFILKTDYENPLFEASFSYPVVDTYYLADIRIPDIVEVNGTKYNVSLFSTLKDKKVYNETEGNVTVDLLIQTLFGDIVSLYGSVKEPNLEVP
ncbi:MAG: hypothetical protein J7K68_05005 [Candidatus Diapherotrites archaeon]|nr:hypothetical protein [Candidatus Diapherotrites archaeon]